jgi:hypothetical protein
VFTKLKICAARSGLGQGEPHTTPDQKIKIIAFDFFSKWFAITTEHRVAISV